MQNDSAPAAHADTAVAGHRREELGVAAEESLESIAVTLNATLGLESTRSCVVGYRGTRTESVLRGGSHDVFRLEER